MKGQIEYHAKERISRTSSLDLEKSTAPQKGLLNGCVSFTRPQRTQLAPVGMSMEFPIEFRVHEESVLHALRCRF